MLISLEWTNNFLFIAYCRIKGNNKAKTKFILKENIEVDHISSKKNFDIDILSSKDNNNWEEEVNSFLEKSL